MSESKIAEQEAYDHLSSNYAMDGNSAFTLQHVVDAYAAQQATSASKPIALFFALVGLCLRVEKGLTGKQVQHVHQLLARRKQDWPRIEIPQSRGGSISAIDVVGKSVGSERDAAVDRWCTEVWNMYRESHETIRREMRARGLDL